MAKILTVSRKNHHPIETLKQSSITMRVDGFYEEFTKFFIRILVHHDYNCLLKNNGHR